MTHQPTKSTLDALAIVALSQVIYDTIYQASQENSALVTSKYRQTPWHLAQVQSTFLSKMTQDLSNLSTLADVARRVKQIIGIFLDPAFFYLPQALDLQTKIRNLLKVAEIKKVEVEPNPVPRKNAISTIINQRDNNQTLSNQLHNGKSINEQNEQVDSKQIPRSDNSGNSGISILLLDVENLQLDAATEKFLGNICRYPIQIKIAFANWRHMGKQDLEFHQRGYELIHVPAGKDSADVKLATVGSSIFIHYPTAKEVLVCSSDTVLTHLCTTLQTHGLGVYLVRKKGETLTALDTKTGKTYTRMLKISPEISSIDHLILQLQYIIQAERSLTGSNWIQLSRLSQLFRSRYNSTISQVVSIHTPGKKAREIFLENPTIFVVHKPTKEAELYISLFDRTPETSPTKAALNLQPNIELVNGANETNGASKTPTPKAILTPTNTSNLTSPIAPTSLSANLGTRKDIVFKSRSDLEAVLIKLIQEITQHDENKSVYIGVLGNQFSRRYGQKITTVVKALKLASSFSLFLESSPVFYLIKTDAQAKVSILSYKNHG